MTDVWYTLQKSFLLPYCSDWFSFEGLEIWPTHKEPKSHSKVRCEMNSHKCFLLIGFRVSGQVSQSSAALPSHTLACVPYSGLGVFLAATSKWLGYTSGFGPRMKMWPIQISLSCQNCPNGVDCGFSFSQ